MSLVYCRPQFFNGFHEIMVIGWGWQRLAPNLKSRLTILMIAPADVASCRGKFKVSRYKCEEENRFIARIDARLNRAFLTNKTMTKQELEGAKAFINAGRVNRATSKRALEILRNSNCGISRVAVYRFLNNQGATSKYQNQIIAAYTQAINERMDNPGRNKQEQERTINAAKRLLAMAG